MYFVPFTFWQEMKCDLQICVKSLAGVSFKGYQKKEEQSHGQQHKQHQQSHHNEWTKTERGGNIKISLLHSCKEIKIRFTITMSAMAGQN